MVVRLRPSWLVKPQKQTDCFLKLAVVQCSSSCKNSCNAWTLTGGVSASTLLDLSQVVVSPLPFDNYFRHSRGERTLWIKDTLSVDRASAAYFLTSAMCSADKPVLNCEQIKKRLLSRSIAVGFLLVCLEIMTTTVAMLQHHWVQQLVISLPHMVQEITTESISCTLMCTSDQVGQDGHGRERNFM